MDCGAFQSQSHSLEVVKIASKLSFLARDTAVYKWRNSFSEIFVHPFNRVPVSIWDYVMKRFGDGSTSSLGDIGGEGQSHYVQVSEEEFSSRQTFPELRSWPNALISPDVAVSSTPITKFFPKFHPLEIDVVDRKTQNTLGVSFQSLPTPTIQRGMELMWNRTMFSDVLVAFPYTENNEGETHNTVVIFACHQFVLKARSSLFRNILDGCVIDGSSWAKIVTNAYNIPIILFRHSTIGPIIWEHIFKFIYTGEFPLDANLTTAFNISKAAAIVRLSSLQSVAHRFAVDKLHGLYYVSLSNLSYSRYEMRGVWAAMSRDRGCCCERCAHYVPVALLLSLRKDTEDQILQRGARRALVGLFGLGWCTFEFATLPLPVRMLVLDDVRRLITPVNVMSMIFAANYALAALDKNKVTWVKDVEVLIRMALVDLEVVLAENYEACFMCQEWRRLTLEPSSWENSGEGKAETRKKLQWIVNSICKVMKPVGNDAIFDILKPFTNVRVLFSTEIDATLVEIWSQPLTQLRQYFLTNYERDTTGSGSSPNGTILAHNKSTDARDEYNTMTKANSPELDRPDSRHSRTSSSFYSASNASYATAPESYASFQLGQPTSLRSGSVFTGDSVESLISKASSRTVSTEYGIFYRRMCLSEEFEGSEAEFS